MVWTAEKIEFVTGGKAFSNWKGGKLVFDSRLIEEGDIFIALNGNLDAHEFVANALEKGAAGAIVERLVKGVDNKKLILVPSAQVALERMAIYKRNNSKAKFIAVTGSVGKTSTKELLGSALEVHGNTFISRANYNNFLGVPINLASIPDSCEYAIIEIGMDHAGEIIPLSLMVKPDICIITNIENIHIANFESLEGIAYAKSEIFAGLKLDSKVILNSLSNHYELLIKLANANKNIRKILSLGIDSKISSYTAENNKTKAILNICSEEIELSVEGIIGSHQIHNFMTALSLIKELGLKLTPSAINMQNFKLPKGRGEVLSIKIEDKKITLIDDSYNAGPVSVAAALKNMANYSNRKVAILGDMTDMGKDAITIHKSLKNDIMANKIDKIICFGNLMKSLYETLPVEVQLGHFTSLDELGKALPSLLEQEDVLLIKGSYYLTNLYHFTQKLKNGTLNVV